MNINQIYELIQKSYKDIIELDKSNVGEYIEFKLTNQDSKTIMEIEKECMQNLFKLSSSIDISNFYLDIINHVHLEIQRVLNDNNQEHKVNICIENEYAKEFLVRVEERMMFLTKGFAPVDVEEYLAIKYHLPQITNDDKLVSSFYKRLIKANYKIIAILANIEVVNPKGRPKMFEELKTIKKQVHTTKMKEYMKTKYNTYQVVNNNLLTSDEFKEIEKCNLSDKIKNKIKMFTKSFIKKD